MTEEHAEIVIIGGSIGGCAAAIAACTLGKTVLMTEETDWIGGQLTSQAVPPDENRWIELFGGTYLYQQFRKRVRDYYMRNYPLTADARKQHYLNPGNGYVSRLCHEPRVALAVLHEMLAPFHHSGRLKLFLNQRPTKVEVNGDTVQSVTVKDTLTGNERVLTGQLFLDATELGDLLPLSGTEYVTGAESQEETGELHAPTGPAQPLNMQSFTFCFALDYFPDENHTIDRPQTYTFWRDYVPEVTPTWTGKLFDWAHPTPTTLERRQRTLFDNDSLWRYRRLIDMDNFAPGTYQSDISLINWPQVDYLLGPICEVPEEEVARHLEGGRQLSLSFLYWLQTEAPRPDGGLGYPGLRLRKDIVGTEDGLAKYPYIRESRRIKALFTVLEEHVGLEMLGGGKAAPFADSVGIGHYNIDLHPSTGNDNYIDVPSAPFQIPLGALLPIRMKNLLPACKNIGVTHITNGCYRLHPVEWNIGESVGYLAAYCLDYKVDPADVHASAHHLQDYQRLLRTQGVQLNWPNIGAD